MGPNCFIARLPASCPASPSGLPGATRLSLKGSLGELTLLMYVSPLPTLQCIYSARPRARHSSNHFSSSRSCLKFVFYRNPSPVLCPCNLFIKLSSFTVTLVKCFKGEVLKACSQPTAFIWECANYLNFTILLPVLCV